MTLPKIIRDWFRRFSADPQAVVLVLILATGTAVILFMGRMLAPVIAAIVIAYLLEGLVKLLQRQGTPRLPAVLVVFTVFCGFMLFLALGMLPLITRQLTQLVQQLPTMILTGQEILLNLPEMYPRFITEDQVREIVAALRAEIAKLGQIVVTWSLASVVGFITIAIYLFLVPLLVFFFLKDKDLILAWLQSFLPPDHTLAKQVWHEVDQQIGNYVRGKFWEILIVWGVTYLTFAWLGLQFAMLLGLMVGLSVLVPYIGAAVVTVPIALVAYFQFGLGSEFIWVMIAYAAIQALDGNVLVPVLFSEVVDLHPIAIIVAVLVFGGLWGFWGLFFAIPLATLLQAVMKAWPRHRLRQSPQPLHASGQTREEGHIEEKHPIENQVWQR